MKPVVRTTLASQSADRQEREREVPKRKRRQTGERKREEERAGEVPKRKRRQTGETG